MGKPYSMDLRERICGYIAAGHSRRAAARVFVVSASTAVRLAAEYLDRWCCRAKTPGPRTRDRRQAQTAHCVSGRDRPGRT